VRLQGQYTLRRLSAAAEDESQGLASEATPQPSLIGAFLPGSAARSAGAGGSPAAQDGLSAAKTPLLHINPLAL